MRTSTLGVAVPVCRFSGSSVLQDSISTSCLGVIALWGLGDLFGEKSSRRSLLSEWWAAATVAEDVLGTGFSFFRDPIYPKRDFSRFKGSLSITPFNRMHENNENWECAIAIPAFSLVPLSLLMWLHCVAFAPRKQIVGYFQLSRGNSKTSGLTSLHTLFFVGTTDTSSMVHSSTLCDSFLGLFLSWSSNPACKMKVNPSSSKQFNLFLI